MPRLTVMPRLPARPARPPRVVVIGLVLSVHGLIVLLLVSGSRIRPRAAEDSIAFIGLWIDPPLPVPPTAPLPPKTVRPGTPQAAPTQPKPESVEVSPTLEPSRAITPVAPLTDWQSEATAVARRQAAQREGPDTFSSPPPAMRKPCEPPESSFVWNPELPRAGLTRTPVPLPFVRLGERCVVGLGFFSCNLSPLPEPNSHLFDDMKDGKTQESSVPDPDVCD